MARFCWGAFCVHMNSVLLPVVSSLRIVFLCILSPQGISGSKLLQPRPPFHRRGHTASLLHGRFFFLTFRQSGHEFIFPNIEHLDVFCFLLHFALRWHYITHRSGCGTSWSLIQFCIQQSHSGLGEFFLAALHHFSVWLFFFFQSCRPLLQLSAAEQRMCYEKKKVE